MNHNLNPVLLHPPGHSVNSNKISQMSLKWVCHQMLELNHIFVYQYLGSDLSHQSQH